MVKPERRTRVDLAVSAAILVAVVVAGFVAWNVGSASKAVSETAPAPSTVPASLVELPAALREAWTASSDRPALSLNGSLVLTRGGEVAGHDPATGQRTWRYQRESDVCGLMDNAGLVLAFYRDVRGCGEVMALDPATGHRRASRTGREDHDVTLTGDGNYAVVQGPTRVDVFRSDLVRTVEYGKPDVPVNSRRAAAVRVHDRLRAARGRVDRRPRGLPHRALPRLTVIGASPKEAAEPQETSSVVSPDLGAAAPRAPSAPGSSPPPRTAPWSTCPPRTGVRRG